MKDILFGNVAIMYRGEGDHGSKYNVFVDEAPVGGIMTNDPDLAVLAALEMKHEGDNGNFSGYAAAMLRIGGVVWYGGPH